MLATHIMGQSLERYWPHGRDRCWDLIEKIDAFEALNNVRRSGRFSVDKKHVDMRAATDAGIQKYATDAGIQKYTMPVQSTVFSNKSSASSCASTWDRLSMVRAAALRSERMHLRLTAEEPTFVLAARWARRKSGRACRCCDSHYVFTNSSHKVLRHPFPCGITTRHSAISLKTRSSTPTLSSSFTGHGYSPYFAAADAFEPATSTHVSCQICRLRPETTCELAHARPGFDTWSGIQVNWFHSLSFSCFSLLCRVLCACRREAVSVTAATSIM